MNFKNRTFKFFILLTYLTVLTNCETEQLENPSETTTIENQDASGLATIPIEQTIEYFKSRDNNPYDIGEDNLLLEVDLSSIRQAEITNTTAKINLIDATTKFENVESTVMQIKIDGTIQTVLYNVIPKTITTSKNSESYLFSGNIVITNLSGIVLNNYQYNSGNLLGEINLNNYQSTHDEPCWGIACGITLDEVVINAPSSNVGSNYYNGGLLQNNFYSSIRSINNYSSMGMAYANYYRSVEMAKWDNITLESEGDKIDPVDETKCFDVNEGGKLTIYVRQPNEDSLNLVGENQVGHVFVGIEQDGKRRLFGFYPPKNASDARIVVGTTYNSELRNNSGDLYHVSISTNINASQMSNIINYVQNHPSEYNLKTYACADFGIAIGNLGGLNLPSTTVTDWLGFFSGRSPAKLGQEIRAMNSTSDKPITKSNAPNKTNEGC